MDPYHRYVLYKAFSATTRCALRKWVSTIYIYIYICMYVKEAAAFLCKYIKAFHGY